MPEQPDQPHRSHRPRLPHRSGAGRLAPVQEERVRRLLAEARHDAPMPPDVVSRLDGAIADLAAEPRRVATVHRLADRRRRAATMLVAAAAVVVAGLSLGRLLGAGSGEESATSADSGAEVEGLGGLDRDGPAAGGPGEAARGDAGGGAVSDTRDGLVVRVRPGRFAVDVDRLRSPVPKGGLERDLSPGCRPGAWGVGTYQAVRYDGSDGWVVLRPPQGATQVADLFLCGSDGALRSVTLPAR